MPNFGTVIKYLPETHRSPTPGTNRSTPSKLSPHITPRMTPRLTSQKSHDLFLMSGSVSPTS